jgi:hypothetical protein
VPQTLQEGDAVEREGNMVEFGRSKIRLLSLSLSLTHTLSLPHALSLSLCSSLSLSPYIWVEGYPSCQIAGSASAGHTRTYAAIDQVVARFCVVLAYIGPVDYVCQQTPHVEKCRAGDGPLVKRLSILAEKVDHDHARKNEGAEAQNRGTV